MSIKRLPNGKFKAIVDVGGRGADREQRTQTFAVEADAKEWEEMTRRRPHDAHRRTVLDAVDRFLALRGKSKEPSTEHRYHSTRDTYIARTWLGAMELDKLTVDHLERFYDEVWAGKHSPARRPGPKSASTVRKIHRLCSIAFRQVKRPGVEWITSNPCEDVEFDPPKEAMQKPSAAVEYDLGDVAAVLDTAERPRPAGKGKAKPYDHAAYALDLADLVQLALVTGAREGELAAVRWRDLALLDTDQPLGFGQVSFYGSIGPKRRGEGVGWVRKSTKGGQPRKVTIDAGTVAMLEARYRRQVAQAHAAGVDPGTLDDCAVFSLELEQDFTSPAALAQRWSRAAKAAGVPLTFHGLRHVNCSEMTAAGVPVTLATLRSGHRSNRMFHDVYSHHGKGGQEVAVAAAAETWRKVTAKRKRGS